MSYKNELQELIKRRMIDEISAATFYLDAATLIRDMELAEEIRDHAKDEFDHFSRLVKFARGHGLEVRYDFDRSVIKNVPAKTKALTSIIQGLERKAISDYREMAILCKDNMDLEGEKFFKTIMLEEMEHFDNVAQKTGETRKLGESFKKFKKFKDKFKG